MENNTKRNYDQSGNNPQSTSQQDQETSNNVRHTTNSEAEEFIDTDPNRYRNLSKNADKDSAKLYHDKETGTDAEEREQKRADENSSDPALRHPEF